MKTITFYSYKGGVGRSLALSNIAIRLSELNKKVCVLDFDLEAPGLQFKFGNYTAAKPIEKGIVDYIDAFTSTHEVPKNIRDFSIDLNPANKFFEKIQLIPAGNIDDPFYWRKLSCINWSSMFYEENSKGVQFFLDLKHKIETELQPDFLLIDSRTGITDIAGITLKLLADEAVILAANNKENLYGSKKIIKSLVSQENSLLGKSPKITFILTRLPYTDTPNDKGKEFQIIERKTFEFRKEFSLPDFKILVIHSDRRLEENERPLIGDDYEAKTVSISNDYLKLFDELTSDVLSQEEILVFKNKKNAEKEFKVGLAEDENSKRIAHFTKAIELDETQAKYFFYRGFACQAMMDLTNAKKDFLRVLELDADSIEALYQLAWLNLEDKNLDEALKYAELMITKDSSDLRSFATKASIFEKQNKKEDALKMFDYVIQEFGNIFEIDEVLNNRADLLRAIGNYNKAYEDIFRAIELNPNRALYFGTLAEIYAADGKISEFFLNLNIALSKGITVKELSPARDVYERFKNDERFINLMAKYSIDFNDIFK